MSLTLTPWDVEALEVGGTMNWHPKGGWWKERSDQVGNGDEGITHTPTRRAQQSTDGLCPNK